MNLNQANKPQIDIVLKNCGWRQTKQRLVLLKTIFNGQDKHFCIDQINQQLKDNKSFFSLTTLYENLSTLVQKGYLKEILVEKKTFMTLT